MYHQQILEGRLLLFSLQADLKLLSTDEDIRISTIVPGTVLNGDRCAEIISIRPWTQYSREDSITWLNPAF